MSRRSRHLIPSPLGRWLATALVSVTFLSFAHPAQAQRLSGRLVDLDSNQPVASGLLTLLTPDSILLATVLTDRNGHWLMEVPEPGMYYLQARRMGYQPWVAGPLELKDGDDFESVFHLQRLAVMLDPIEITAAAATRRYLDRSGFFERQRSDFGHFMTPEDIQKRQATRMSDLLMSLPGVNMVTTGSVGSRHIELRGGGLQQGGSCRPRVFVDGLMYARGDARSERNNDDIGIEQQIDDQIARLDQGLNIDDIGHPSTIAAVEIYRSPVQVPVQFGGTSVETQCGVIVVWTRTGRMRIGGR